MENRTKTGVLLVLIGLITGIISNICLSLFSFTIVSVSPLNPFYLVLAGAAGIGGLLILIGAILIIVDRQNYGEKHSKYAMYAVILYVLGIIAAVIISVIVSYVAFSSRVYTYGGTAENIYNLSGVSTLISTILGGFAYVFLFHELEDKTGKYILYSAVIASITTSSIIALYTMGLLNGIYALIQTSDYLTSIMRLSFLPVISSSLLILAVYIAYKRIDSGELKKVLPSNKKRCSGCGRIVPHDSKVCAYCGLAFSENNNL